MITLPHVCPSERLELSKEILGKIEAILAEGQGFENIEWNIDFRGFARTFIPELYDRAIVLREMLQEKKAIVISIPSLVDQALDVKKFLFFCLCASIGKPTATDKTSKRILWEVTPQKIDDEKYIATITQHSRYGPLHTDSAYRDTCPENYVSFMCVRQSRDNNGVSLLIDAREMIADIAKTTEGRECLNYVSSNSFPFATPRVFCSDVNSSDVEITNAPIISDSPFFRYRYDCLKAGLEHGGKNNIEAIKYLEQLNYMIENSETHKYLMKDSDIMLLDNHEVLHGRTAFDDQSRMLCRIRMEKSD